MEKRTPSYPALDARPDSAGHARLRFAIRKKRFDYVALYLVLGVILLLKPVPPRRRIAFIRSLESDPHIVDRVVALVEPYLDARR